MSHIAVDDPEHSGALFATERMRYYLRVWLSSHPNVEWLVGIAKTLLVAVASLLFFAIAFSGTQSLILAVVVAVLYMASGRAVPSAPFVPYRVEIKPNLRTIATDFELMEDTDEAWNKLEVELQKLLYDPQWYACRRGFSFSLSYVTPSGLIYNNATKEFITQVDLGATLEPLTLTSETHSIFPQTPRLRLNVSTLSIELPKWHWERICNKQVFKEVADREKGQGRWSAWEIGEGDWAEVKLALIHYSEFQVHFVPSWEEDAIRAHRRRRKFRDRFGWKGDEARPWSHEIEHRYCRVSHSRL